jgi:hypothetical protein
VQSKKIEHGYGFADFLTEVFHIFLEISLKIRKIDLKLKYCLFDKKPGVFSQQGFDQEFFYFTFRTETD